jgi:hypothetical protein
VSDLHDYKARGEECCRYAIDALTVAERELWLAIAGTWQILAQSTTETALQNLAQRIVECGRESRGGTLPMVKTEERSPLLSRALALRSADNSRADHSAAGPRSTLRGLSQLFVVDRTALTNLYGKTGW